MKRHIYKTAIIGTGRIGFSLGFDKKREQPASHTMALRKNKNFRIESACDTEKARLEHWQKYNPKAAVYSSAAHLFASTKPEVVVIAVNESSHLQTALEAIYARPKLIILEKPVALNLEDALTIQENAKDYNVPILVNHERRFAEDYKFAKKYMSKIGTILTINARLDSGLYVYNKQEEVSGAYSLLHDGTHLIDGVMYLLEEECGEENVLQNLILSSIVHDEKSPEIIRNITAHFRSKKCKDINIFMSGRSKFFGFEIDIIGSEGRIKVGNGIFEFYRREESRLYSGFYSLAPDIKVQRPLKTLYFSNMVQNAADFLNGKSPLLSTIQTGVNTMKVIEEIKKGILFL